MEEPNNEVVYNQWWHNLQPDISQPNFSETKVSAGIQIQVQAYWDLHTTNVVTIVQLRIVVAIADIYPSIHKFATENERNVDIPGWNSIINLNREHLTSL